jgi:hypothetical protein
MFPLYAFTIKWITYLNKSCLNTLICNHRMHVRIKLHIIYLYSKFLSNEEEGSRWSSEEEAIKVSENFIC